MILIAESEKILYHRAFGYQNLAQNIPNSKNTLFGIGSISKVFTGIIVEKMVKAEKLDLSKKVEEFIEGFPRGPKGNAPTIKHLYEHTSGVPHRVTNTEQEATFLTTSDMVRLVKDSELKFKPGKKRLYSSAGYTVLAHIIELIEKKPFDEVMQEQIFRPGGLINATTESANQTIPNQAHPYFLGTSDGEVTAIPARKKSLGFLTGAGSVYDTNEDLLRFVISLKDGSIGSDSWHSRIAKSKEWKSWTGRSSGYEAYLDVFPKKDIVLIVLTNLRSAATWQIRNQVKNILTGGRAEEIDLPPKVTANFEPTSDLVGSYDINGSVVEIKFMNNRLYRGQNEFYPTPDKNYYIPASGTRMKFRRDQSGKVDALIQIRGQTETAYLMTK